jgi:hypothetical protein
MGKQRRRGKQKERSDLRIQKRQPLRNPPAYQRRHAERPRIVLPLVLEHDGRGPDVHEDEQDVCACEHDEESLRERVLGGGAVVSEDLVAGEPEGEEDGYDAEGYRAGHVVGLPPSAVGE